GRDVVSDCSCCVIALFAFISSVFFFQAEDGIRDRNVTGVQTCALPISPPGAPGGVRRKRTGGPDRVPAPGCKKDGESGREHPARSEERRVGKECRSGWSPYT